MKGAAETADGTFRMSFTKGGSVFGVEIDLTEKDWALFKINKAEFANRFLMPALSTLAMSAGK